MGVAISVFEWSIHCINRMETDTCDHTALRVMTSHFLFFLYTLTHAVEMGLNFDHVAHDSVFVIN